VVLRPIERRPIAVRYLYWHIADKSVRLRLIRPIADDVVTRHLVVAAMNQTHAVLQPSLAEHQQRPHESIIA